MTLKDPNSKEPKKATNIIRKRSRHINKETLSIIAHPWPQKRTEVKKKLED